MKTTDLAAGNILLPNGTFFVELIIFLIVLFVMWRYITPPIVRAMREREERVRRTAEQNQQAADKLTEAEQRYQEALAEARNESTRIRETARAEGQRILNELRDQARSEADGVVGRGAEELAAQRAQAMRELQTHIGDLAVTLASRVLGEDLSAAEGRSSTVARFLDEQSGKVEA